MEKTTEIQKQVKKYIPPDNDAIKKMAFQFKIPIFPCKNDKTPFTKNGFYNASCEKAQIKYWETKFKPTFWGMPTDQFFALDKDGPKSGKIKTEWLNNNPYTQQTPSGFFHWLFKNPNSIVKNSVRFTGDFDIRGKGGYIILYRPIFTSFNPPDGVPIAPPELFTLVPKHAKTKTKKDTWPEGKRNDSLNKSVHNFALSGDLEGIFKSMHKSGASGLSWEETHKTLLSATAKTGIPKLQTVVKQKEEKIIIETEKMIMNALLKLKQNHLKNIDKAYKIEFHDKNQIMPKRNLFLLSGGTECGKTSHSLEGHLKDRLKAKDFCIIWEHSETNRMNRLINWWESIGYNQKPDNLFLSTSRLEIIKQFKPGAFVFIDDTDSFFIIRKTTDRREVADKLEVLSWLCQLIGFTALCCHYQSKTARKEKDVKDRSGGDATWINKIRYGGIIEKAKKTESDKDETPYLTLQKGKRSKSKPKAWWLNKDFTIGDPIANHDIKEIIKQKTEGQDELLSNVKIDCDDYLGGLTERESTELYRILLSKYGMTANSSWRMFNKAGFETFTKGFGPEKTGWIRRKKV